MKTVMMILATVSILSGCGQGPDYVSKCGNAYEIAQAKAAQIQPNVTTFPDVELLLGPASVAFPVDASTTRYSFQVGVPAIPHSLCVATFVEVVGQTVTSVRVVKSEL